MIRLALRNLAQHKLRTVLTTVAILLGVAMISGTYVLTDQIDSGFKNIYDSAMGEIDAIVTAKPAFGDALGGQNDTVSAATLATVRKVNGVQQAAGGAEALGTAVVNGKAISTSGAPTIVLSDMGEKFNNVTWTGGAHPTEGSVAVDSGFLKKQHLKIGDRFGLGTSHGVQPVTISGTFDFGVKGSSMGGAILIAGTLADVQRWYDLQDKFSYIDASRAPGVSREELTARLRAALPKNLQVKTGAQSAADGTKAVTDALGSVLKPALLAFGGVALLVGAFIIFNTFSITVAQRRREFAMLRTLGASRRQVLGSVIAEAAILGIAASVAGLFTGLGVAKGINALFKAVGADIPVGGLALQTRTIVYALAIGILVTLLAAIIPALRATRVPPIAALQHGAQLPASRFSRYTPIFGGLFAVVGAGVIAMGFVTHGTTSQRLLEMGLGALLLFIAVATVARYIVRPVARVLGLVIERIAGTSGRLARENAVRNPGRTASTAASLMIGLAVVVFVAVFAAGLKSSFADAIDTSIRADLVISSSSGTMLPAGAAETARNVPSVGYVTALSTTEVKLPDGKTGSLIGIIPDDMRRVWNFHWLHGGADALLGRVGTTGALIEEQFALAHKLHIGQRVSVLARSGKHATFTVVGEFRDPNMLSGMVVGENAFTLLAGRSEAMNILVKALPGSDLPATQKAVAAAMKQYPAAKVQTKAEFVTTMRKQIDQMLMMLYALLAVSVLISIFGIVNTLVLSVYERTREIGMLRAIGATRRQIRRMVRYESVITAIMGGALGIALGTVFAYVVTTQFGGQGLSFSVPGVQLAIFMVIAIVVGVLAAVLPARRASRVDILQAIQYE